MTGHLELWVLGLLAAVAGLVMLSNRLGVPYPVFLVLGGLALGLVPIVPEIGLPPDLVLLIFLPPLLYSAAFFSSPRDLKSNLRPIASLSIGLVLLTTITVALVAHLLVGLPWAAAFVLGAIVSPIDPVAATAIAGRLGAPRRIVTILEGESLINDGTALVLYSVAVSAVVTGTFSLPHAVLDRGPARGDYRHAPHALCRLHSGRRARRLRRARHGRDRTLPRLAQSRDDCPAQPPAVVRVMGRAAILAQLGAVHPPRVAASQHPREYLGRVLDNVGGAVRRARKLGGDRDAAALDVPGYLPAPLLEPVHPRAKPLSSLATSRRRRLHGHEGGHLTGSRAGHPSYRTERRLVPRARPDHLSDLLRHPRHPRGTGDEPAAAHPPPRPGRSRRRGGARGDRGAAAGG